MSKVRIVAICLLRNEESYVGQMLANIEDFCDEILIADNGSSDSTYDIAMEWAGKRSKITCRRIRHPRESHEMIERFANTPTWIFAVDGDELYDPVGLKQFRMEVMSGTYDKSWQVAGNVLNCISINRESNVAEGYLSPPCRSITKLFNFNAIVEWTGAPVERLHDGHIVFKPGFDDSSRYPLNEESSWHESKFRCLHLCFLPRSRLDTVGKDGTVTRWNLAEQHGGGLFARISSVIFTRIGRYKASRWKKDRYGRGKLVDSSIDRFFERSPKP
ncbi:MAG: hypothetical protein C0404_09115 [Verrucomicrobia bacterium]|nr:hypothetical protein [Verrucomicrobiota bacterium]